MDPGAHKKAMKAAKKIAAANSFEAIAREWHTKQKPDWAPAHAAKVPALLENDVFPQIGGRPITEIDATEGLNMLRLVEGRVVGTAQHCVPIIDYAIITGRAKANPFRGLHKGLTKYRENVFPIPLKPGTEEIDISRLGEILNAIDGCSATPTVKFALKLAPLVFVRPSELRQARWADVDLEAAQWRFITSKTKVQHIVPLSRQALEVLQDIHLAQGVLVFRPCQKAPVSGNALQLGGMVLPGGERIWLS